MKISEYVEFDVNLAAVLEATCTNAEHTNLQLNALLGPAEEIC
jgi:hypothetical protein